ncbi:MAG: glycoside hydrolase family 3 N-terminal domain-containing protein [Planctomycetota bacterium]
MAPYQATLPRLDALSLEEKIGQLVFVRIGSNLPPIVTASDDEARVAELIGRRPIGGLLLFNGVWPEVAESLRRLQERSRWPLLVGADLERGAGQQLAGLTVFPHAAALDRSGDGAAEAAHAVAAATATEARSAGVSWLLGPVADVNTNPNNPIIATRAFAPTPDRAAELAAAWVAGAQSAGGLATAKHFPGHGDTDQDSHAELPLVTKTDEQIRRDELTPFRAAIDAGAAAIMTAHIVCPALDPSRKPATFSAPMLRGLLREELGFDGVICSDSLLMEGAKTNFASEGEMAAAAVAAGVDVLLDVADPPATIEHLGGEVDAGRLPEETINAAAERVLRMKAKALGAGEAAEPSDTPRALAVRVATAAVERRSPAAERFVLDGKRSLVAVLLKPFELPTDPPRQPLADELEKLSASASYFEFGPEPQEEQVAKAVEAAAAAEQVLVAVIAKPAAWHAFGLNDAQESLVKRLLDLPGEVAIASLGVPTVLERFADSAPKFCTYSDAPVSQAALVQTLFAAHSAPSWLHAQR